MFTVEAIFFFETVGRANIDVYINLLYVIYLLLLFSRIRDIYKQRYILLKSEFSSGSICY